MTYKKLIERLNKECRGANIFKFDHLTYSYLILGYPNLRAFISVKEHDFWLEIEPVVNVHDREIDFPYNIDEVTYVSANPDVEKKKIKSREVIKSEVHKKLEDEFFQTFPPDVLKYVVQFSDSHWELLKAITYYDKYFIDFIVSNQAIAYILVNLDKFNYSYSLFNSMNFLDVAIGNKQKEILKRALFPDTQRMVKILSKFDPAFLTVKELISFRNSFASNPDFMDRVQNILSHITVINKNLIRILSDEPNIPNILTVNTLRKLIEPGEFDKYFPIVKEIFSEAMKWKIKLPEITDISHIEKVKINLSNAIKKKQDRLIKFPIPPIPGNEFIIPVLNHVELIAWGKRQHNCISTYSNKIQAGDCYIYKVIEGKKEATLEIKNSKGKIRRGSFLGPDNTKVSEKLKLIVHQWWKVFKKNQKEILLQNN
ncbi:MAG: PcfJ domain-containing protein [Melioribacteraceae bacterium]|nr:PcfJ domain-containing protein [Melioribacteraceae bacterium]